MGEAIPELLPWSDVPDLIRIYRESGFEYYGVYLILENVYRWHMSEPGIGMHVLSPNGKTDEYGTFVVYFFENRNIILGTTNPEPLEMKSFLVRCVEEYFKRQSVLVFGPVPQKLWAVKDEVIADLKLTSVGTTYAYSFYLEIEQAKELISRCPDNVYVDQLKETHVDTINELWPYRFEGSTRLLQLTINLNGGVGVFLKESGELVAWGVHGHYNGPGFLQTVDSQKRKGYGQLAAVEISKFIADKGVHPYCYIVDGNTPSLTLHSGLRYKEHIRHVWQACTKS